MPMLVVNGVRERQRGGDLRADLLHGHGSVEERHQVHLVGAKGHGAHEVLGFRGQDVVLLEWTHAGALPAVPTVRVCVLPVSPERLPRPEPAAPSAMAAEPFKDRGEFQNAKSMHRSFRKKRKSFWHFGILNP